MIRIRYRDLSARADEVTWLYGRAERSHAGTVIYLQPGLTAAARRAAVRRLRQEASRGLGPPLPAIQLRLAIAVDGVRATFGALGGVIRLHPAALLPGVGAAALAAFFVLAGPAGPVGPVGPGHTGPGNVVAGDTGPVLRPRTIVIVPPADRAAAWYVRSREPAGSGPPLALDQPLTFCQPRRCSKPRTVP